MRFINTSILHVRDVEERKILTGGHYRYTIKKRSLGVEKMNCPISYLYAEGVTQSFIINQSHEKEGKGKPKGDM